MKLKEKILLKAVSLFNERGIANVSPNQIATALGISSGNLTYHYKTKASLVTAIYERMHQESSGYINLDGYLTLEDFRQSMIKFRQLQQKYSFCFHDMVFIRRNFPEAGQLHEKTNVERFLRGRRLVDYYIQSGRMVAETDGIDYSYLIHAIWMVSSFWSAQEVVMTNHNHLGGLHNSVTMTWHMIRPYLTEKGLEEYKQIDQLFEKQLHKI